MSYFPMYLKIDNKQILIIGGGKIATEKLEKLLDFTNHITMLAEEFCDKISQIAKENNLKTIQKRYESNDIDGFDIVVVAIDNIQKQKEIYFEAKSKNILCNSVDTIEYCDFIFPSYIKKGDLTISISTSGASPAVAKYLRRYIEKLIPKKIDKFLTEMKDLRKKLPKGKDRMKLLDKKAKDFFHHDNL